MTQISQNRPTSPHLTIYRPQISSVLSITHRLTGLALVAGSVVLVAWLWSAAYSADCFRQLHEFFGQWYGQILLIGWTAAFYYHFCNGIRHLWWDIGRGFEIKQLHFTGWLTIIATLVLTAATWWLAGQGI